VEQMAAVVKQAELGVPVAEVIRKVGGAGQSLSRSHQRQPRTTGTRIPPDDKSGPL